MKMDDIQLAVKQMEELREYAQQEAKECEDGDIAEGHAGDAKAITVLINGMRGLEMMARAMENITGTCPREHEDLDECPGNRQYRCPKRKNDEGEVELAFSDCWIEYFMEKGESDAV